MKLAEFREHAKNHNVIPVYRKLLADGETPLNIYKKLAQNKPGTFLLESAEHGGVWSRYSFIGVTSQTTLTEKDGQAQWIGKPPVGVPTGVDPLTALRESSAAFSAAVKARPRLRKRNPSGASRLNPPPRPGTTSMTSWVCFQAWNCEPEIHTGASARTPSRTSRSPTMNSPSG
jgi:anthranilate/para-aminobenzoate synthase component I